MKKRDSYGEYAGIVVVSNDVYEEYKGTLKEQIYELQERIDKAVEIIEKHKDYEDEGLLVEETIKLLDILKGKD